MSISVAVLTVSDTAFRSDPSEDTSGPAVAQVLSEASQHKYEVVSTAIVPDERDEITRVVRTWCEAGISLVLTTGGTGFGVRDVTPEALAPLIDKFAPGILALMYHETLQITDMTALSRAVAGIHSASGTVILALPGSPKAVKENLKSVMSVLPHAVHLASGGTGREQHAKMGLPERGRPKEPVQTSTPHQHHHHHHHGHSAPKPRTQLSLDPSSSAADRQRKSPYPLVPLREAIQSILDHTPVNPVDTEPVSENLASHVIATDVGSERDVPLGPSTNVDGYAVSAKQTAGIYDVLVTWPTSPLQANQIYRINTGAPLPPGTDAVIMVEDTDVVSRTSDGEEETVRLLAQVDVGENVRKAGSDVKKGERVLAAGDVISAVGGEIGSLAFVGKREVSVYRRPRVAILSTGNELVDLQQDSGGKDDASFSGIVDSNRPSLISVLKHHHFDVIDLGIVGDSMADTTKALRRGAQEADVIITTGGTSMGVGDLLKPCIERELNGTIHFGRVAMKPGKPTTFATIPSPSPDHNDSLVFALPGNPASALVTFFVFVLPALRKLEGRRNGEWELPRVQVEIASDVDLDPRPEYHRVWVRPSKSGLVATSTGGQRSSRTVSLANTNGLLELPALKEGGEVKIKKGTLVECVIVGELGV